MNWHPYNDCCRRRATDQDALICPDCGHPLLRCHGFDECGQLVEPNGHCPIHVAPRLQLQRDALPSPRVGDRLSLPLTLENAARVGRAVKVLHVYRLRGGGRSDEVELQWDKLPPGHQRGFSVDTDALVSGGYQRTRLNLVLSVPFPGVQEDYAFSAEIGLRIAQQQSNQVVQNIHVEGGRFEAGASAVLQTGPSVASGFSAGDPATAPAGRTEVALERAERFELNSGLRGYRDSGITIPRTVEVLCEGFPAADLAPQRQPFLNRPSVSCGRSSTRYQADQNPQPNFLCLRAYHPHSGELQVELSRRISRRHFELTLSNGRLSLHNRGRTGTFNGAPFAGGDSRELHDGDRFNPLELGMRFLDVQVRFDTTDGNVDRIRLQRQA